MNDFSAIDKLTIEQIIDGQVRGSLEPTIHRIYLTRGSQEAFNFIQGIILSLAGAADALGGNEALKILIDLINQAADESAQDDMVRS